MTQQKLSYLLITLLLSSITFTTQAANDMVQSKAALQAPTAERAQSAIQEMEALFNGAWAKRILENRNEVVSQLLNDAEANRNAAKQAAAANDHAKAVELSDNAKHKFLEAASKATPKKSIEERLELEYKQSLASIQTLIEAYKQTTSDKPQGQAGDTLNKANELSNQAKELAGSKKFKEASEVLDKADIILKTAITSLMQGSTVTAVKDESPKGIYEYEIFRNDTYKALIEMLVDKKLNVTKEAGFIAEVKLAEKIRAEAEQIGKKGEFETASSKLLESTAAYKKAADQSGIQIPE